MSPNIAIDCDIILYNSNIIIITCFQIVGIKESQDKKQVNKWYNRSKQSINVSLYWENRTLWMGYIYMINDKKYRSCLKKEDMDYVLLQKRFFYNQCIQGSFHFLHCNKINIKYNRPRIKSEYISKEALRPFSLSNLET